MHDTAERIRLIRQRADELRQKKDKRSQRLLLIFCLALSLALVQAFASVTRGRRGSSVQEMLGATLMFEDAGAYVLVGLLSFTVAVVITILCLRHRNKKEVSQTDHVQKEDSHLHEE